MTLHVHLGSESCWKAAHQLHAEQKALTRFHPAQNPLHWSAQLPPWPPVHAARARHPHSSAACPPGPPTAAAVRFPARQAHLPVAAQAVQSPAHSPLAAQARQAPEPSVHPCMIPTLVNVSLLNIFYLQHMQSTSLSFSTCHTGT